MQHTEERTTPAVALNPPVCIGVHCGTRGTYSINVMKEQSTVRDMQVRRGKQPGVSLVGWFCQYSRCISSSPRILPSTQPASPPRPSHLHQDTTHTRILHIPPCAHHGRTTTACCRRGIYRTGNDGNHYGTSCRNSSTRASGRPCAWR